MCRSDFKNVWSSLTSCFPKGPLKEDFLEIYLTKFFGVRNFGNTSAVRVIFFGNYSKLNMYFKNAVTNSENVFCFLDNCVWIGSLKLSLLRREYLSSAVNMLTNIPKILHMTKRDFFQLNCFHSDQWIWWRWCCSDFKSVWSSLTCYFLKSPLKVDFLEICLTTF